MPDITTNSGVSTKNAPEQTITIQIDADSTFTFKNAALSPPIIIVGTNKNSISSEIVDKDEYVRTKFARIKDFLLNKVYSNHIVEPYLAVDASLGDKKHKKDKNNSISKNDLTVSGETNGEEKDNIKDTHMLKKVIELASLNEPYMGELQPLKWMRFEKSLEKLKGKNIFYASLSQVKI